MFERWKRRGELRRLLSPYLSPMALDSLVNEPSLSLPGEGNSEHQISFLIAIVRGDQADRIPGLVETAVEVILDHGGIVHATLSSLLLGTFDMTGESDPTSVYLRCQEAAHRLSDRMGTDVRVGYGRVRGYFAVLGTKECMSYGPVLPCISHLLDEALAIESGEAIEIYASASEVPS